jgi:glycine cleavage system transcriptional repressor
MTYAVRVSVSCRDRPGLLASVTARIFDLGGNLGDTSFAVLGSQAELASICELPTDVSVQEAERELRSLPGLAEAEVSVVSLARQPVRSEGGQVTHQFEVHGSDRPGVIARLAEGFAEFGANVIRMDSAWHPDGKEGKSVARFELAIPHDRVETCLSAAINTAESMGLEWQSRMV